MSLPSPKSLKQPRLRRLVAIFTTVAMLPAAVMLGSVQPAMAVGPTSIIGSIDLPGGISYADLHASVQAIMADGSGTVAGSSVVSTNDGTFAITGLTEGTSYRLQLIDTNRWVVDGYYSADGTRASDFWAAVSVVPSDLPVILTPAKTVSITGTVELPEGVTYAELDAYVTAYGEDSPTRPAKVSTTDGTFDIPHLTPGTSYQLIFVDNNGVVLAGSVAADGTFVPNPWFAYSVSSADSPQTVQVSKAATITGTVKLPDGVSYADLDAVVTAYTSAGTWTGRVSATDGTFTITGLVPGASYRMKLVDLNGAVLSGYYVTSGRIMADSGSAIGITLPVAPLNIYPDAGVREALVATPTPLISGDARVGHALSVLAGSWDSGVTLAYQWLRNGAVIDGATSASYVLGGQDAGANISVSVTGSKAHFQSATQTSLPMLVGTPVPETELTSTPVPLISGTTKVGKVLSAAAGSWDSGVTLAYQWSRNGSPVAGATATSYVLSAADLGTSITVRVTGTKPEYTSVSKTSAIAKISVGTLSATPVPSILGSAKVGKKLTAKPHAWDAGVKLSYRWSSGGKVIKGATTTTLIVAKKYVGKKITLTVTGAKAGYTTVAKSSKAVKVKMK